MLGHGGRDYFIVYLSRTVLWGPRVSDMWRTCSLRACLPPPGHILLRRASISTSPTTTQRSRFAHSYYLEQANREWRRKQLERRREEGPPPALGGCCMLKGMCGFGARVLPDVDQETPVSVSPRARAFDVADVLIGPPCTCGGRGKSKTSCLKNTLSICISWVATQQQ